MCAGNVRVRSTLGTRYSFLSRICSNACYGSKPQAPHEKCGRARTDAQPVSTALGESVPLLAPLFSLPIPDHHSLPLNLSPQRQRQQTLEALVVILLEQAEQQPLLFIVEDLHWVRSDHAGVSQPPGRPRSHRPHPGAVDLSSRLPHPVDPGRAHLAGHTQSLAAAPGGGDDQPGGAGQGTADEVVEQVVAKTDGVPLFVEELTKMVLESGLLQEHAERYELRGPLPRWRFPPPCTTR